MTTKTLTPRQNEALTWIVQFIAAKGYPPTRSEISKGMGWASPNAAEQHLQALEAKGYLRLTSGISRGILVLREAAA